MREDSKLLVHKLIWTVLFLIGILIPVIIATRPEKNVTIIENQGFINDYYESLNETSCEIKITFSEEIDSGSITIAFYDADSQFLSEETEYLFGFGTTMTCNFYSVSGKVDSYEIVDFSVSISDTKMIIAFYCSIAADIFIFAFFIGALLLSCKTYYYEGKKIIVYAGWYHHYIKVDDEKVDEHNTLITYTAIYLSAVLEDGTTLEATISMANRISLKIDGRLYRRRSY